MIRIRLDGLAEGVDHLTDGDTQRGQTQPGDEVRHGRRQTDEEQLTVLANDGEKAADDGAQIVDELADGGSGADDLTDGLSQGGQAQTGDELGDRTAEADKQNLQIVTHNAQNAVDNGGDILQEAVLALQALADGADEVTDGVGDRGQAKTLDETRKGRVQANEEVSSILAGNGEKAFDRVT